VASYRDREASSQRRAIEIARAGAMLLIGLGLIFDVRVGRAELIAPWIGLRSWHDPGDVRVGVRASRATLAAPRTSLRPLCRLFLLLFRACSLALALSTCQRIPSSHLPVL
jgi:hypothetical protein